MGILKVSKYRVSIFSRPLVLLSAGIFCLSLNACVDIPRDTLPVSLDPQVALRGKVLVEGVAACGFCHGNPLNPKAPLTGGRIISTDQGRVEAPNITPSASGIGRWDMEELLLGLRGVQSRDPEKEFYGSAHKSYSWLSQEDAYSALSYLKLLDPVEKRVPRNHESNGSLGLGSARNIVNPGFVPSIKPISMVSSGRYLAMRAGRCLECHVAPEDDSSWYAPSFLFGSSNDGTHGKMISFDGKEKEAPLLFDRLSEQQLMTFLETGALKKNRPVDPRFCPTAFFKDAPTEHKQALAAFFATKR